MSNQDIRELDSHRADRQAFVGKGSIYIIASVLQLTGALLVQPILSRLLPEGEYGRVALAVVISNLLGLVITLGIPEVITREHFITSGKASARTAVAIGSGFALLLGSFAVITGPFWATPLHGFDLALALGTATAITYAIITCSQALARAQGHAGRFMTVAVVNVVGGQIAGLVAVTMVSPTAVVYLWGVAAGSAAGALLALLWAQPTLVGISDKSTVTAWFRMAWPAVLHTAALFLMAAGDRLVIEIQRGPEAVAPYSLAYLAGAVGVTLVAATNNAWMPLIFGAPKERRWRLLAATTTDMVRLIALVASGLAMAAPLALWIIADPRKYDIAALTPVMAITALAAVPYVLYLASSYVLFWAGKTRALLWVTPLAVTVNLGLKALVLPWGGFVGVAAITVVAYALLALLLVPQQRRLADVPWSGWLTPAAGAVALCLLGAVLPLTWWGHTLRVVIIAALLAATLVVLRHIMKLRRPIQG